MANHKSAEKRIKIQKKKTLRNQMVKSALKTAIKRFEAALEASDGEQAADLYKAASSSLDSAVSKGVIHKNMAARKKSRLGVRLNAIGT